MASSPIARRLYYLLLLVLLLLPATLSSPSARASSERLRRRVEDKPALPPAVVVPERARQEFHVVPTTGGPVRERRSRARGGGTGAWTFSAMLPRGFVPPSGSSACHNDMPDTAADAQFFACSGAGTP
ncbi:hypothetical protein BDA96_10G210200 [Sorghum bicolor]|jgi:hypothetical protein|uniref:Uncharacterized protein n=2 Tax=Sorghum bicolor TaxID=4558 RepID=A0A921Q3N0_SORBI|nr:uncharacterized protein LOC8072680 [Sorghum bicolor]EER88482.1 hypothetical protein SORBI_3010G160200 [Sorghum bicolor]KAG0514637.1 hypothetical protein BDA96_10G210200 [Sorghum bicolor]|eukprot:XP_002437115.1 uncharacterized protein LOC8072680 [Sorghum bicolor]